MAPARTGEGTSAEPSTTGGSRRQQSPSRARRAAQQGAKQPRTTKVGGNDRVAWPVGTHKRASVKSYPRRKNHSTACLATPAGLDRGSDGHARPAHVDHSFVNKALHCQTRTLRRFKRLHFQTRAHWHSLNLHCQNYALRRLMICISSMNPKGFKPLSKRVDFLGTKGGAWVRNWATVKK